MWLALLMHFGPGVGVCHPGPLFFFLFSFNWTSTSLSGHSIFEEAMSFTAKNWTCAGGFLPRFMFPLYSLPPKNELSSASLPFFGVHLKLLARVAYGYPCPVGTGQLSFLLFQQGPCTARSTLPISAKPLQRPFLSWVRIDLYRLISGPLAGSA